MELKPGYKQTEVGVIPEDWEVNPVGDIAVTFSGGTPSTQRPEFYGGDIPWITSGDLNKGRIYEVAGKITRVGLDNSSAKLVKNGTLLIALYGATAGVAAVANLDAAINQAVLAIIPKDADREYLFQWLTHNKRFIIDTYTQGGQPNLSGEIIRSVFVGLPPLPEQRAIAAALSDMDALIQSQDALIAKKCAIKQAAMQQLLTGKQRLPGFSGEWEVKRLGEIAKLYQPITISTDQFTTSGFPVYGANGVVGYFHRFNHESWQTIVTCRGSTCGVVNKTVDRSWITGNAMVLNCDDNKQLDKEFFYHLIKGQDFSDCITGSGQPQIVRPPLQAFLVSLPVGKNEQTAIAEVLSDMDAEIAALEAQRDKTRVLKQGMMQELLTGKTRLV